jgi:hypothetical protein
MSNNIKYHDFTYLKTGKELTEINDMTSLFSGVKACQFEQQQLVHCQS